MNNFGIYILCFLFGIVITYVIRVIVYKIPNKISYINNETGVVFENIGDEMYSNLPVKILRSSKDCHYECVNKNELMNMFHMDK